MLTDLPAFEQKFVTLFDRPELWWLALVVAVGVGALHAVAPGHGKSITAAYLVGSRARYRDAASLGAIVAGMHTFSVLVLALAWVGFSAASTVATEAVTAWLQAAAGLVVVGVGALMVRRALRGGHGHAHGRGHGHGHGHPHDHAQSHDHGHAHGAPLASTDAAGLSTAVAAPVAAPHVHQRAARRTGLRPGLVALGLSGGLLPSPSAFLVLVSGLLTGRALDGLVMVVAFGVGLALTLTAVGMATVWGASALELRSEGGGRFGRIAAVAPAVAGAAVIAGGALYLLTAVSTLAA